MHDEIRIECNISNVTPYFCNTNFDDSIGMKLAVVLFPVAEHKQNEWTWTY